MFTPSLCFQLLCFVEPRSRTAAAMLALEWGAAGAIPGGNIPGGASAQAASTLAWLAACAVASVSGAVAAQRSADEASDREMAAAWRHGDTRAAALVAEAGRR